MQEESSETPTQNPIDGSALGLMKVFVRSLRLEPRFLHYFGEQNLQIVEHIIQTVKKSMPSGFSSFRLWQALFFLTSDRFQRWYINLFLRKGFDTFIMARKVMIDAKIKSAIENEGVKQVVFLGAGYDPRAFLQAQQYKAVIFFEIDRGFTYEQKVKALQTLPAQIGFGIIDVLHRENADIMNQNLICLKCDLSKANLIEQLRKNGFDLSLKTLIIAEGLTLYLSKKDLDALFESLHALMTDESEIIISFVGKFKTTTKREALFKKKEEQRLFSIQSQHVMYYVHAHGFKIKEKFTTKSSMILEKELWIKKYYENPTRRQTAYYTLVKTNSNFNYKSMDEIPEMQIDLASIVNQKNTTNE